MKALVIAEHRALARELCAGARTMADEVVLVSFDEGCEGVADKVAKVSVPAGSVLDDAYLSVIAVFDAEAPDIVLVEPTRHLKSIVGKLAVHAGASAVTDVLSFEADGARSLYFGGVAERVRRPEGGVAFFTVTPGVFEGLEAFGSGAVDRVDWIAPERPVKLVSSKPIEKRGADLAKADVVVACGRGFAEESELEGARLLADKLDAGLACSRPLVESTGWMPREAYVGVSGLMLSPRVYVACGISGQMQHMVGCNRSGTIFAINKDRDAPIFKQCDYGLVGDLKDILPTLAEML